MASSLVTTMTITCDGCSLEVSGSDTGQEQEGEISVDHPGWVYVEISHASGESDQRFDFCPKCRDVLMMTVAIILKANPNAN